MPNTDVTLRYGVATQLSTTAVAAIVLQIKSGGAIEIMVSDTSTPPVSWAGSKIISPGSPLAKDLPLSNLFAGAGPFYVFGRAAEASPAFVAVSHD